MNIYLVTTGLGSYKVELNMRAAVRTARSIARETGAPQFIRLATIQPGDYTAWAGADGTMHRIRRTETRLPSETRTRWETRWPWERRRRR